jgi:hypothetical protein
MFGFLGLFAGLAQSVDWTAVYHFFFGMPGVVQAGSSTVITVIVALAAGGWLVIRANGTVRKARDSKELLRVLKEERE